MNIIKPTKEIKAKAILLGKELQKLGSGYFRRLKVYENDIAPSNWVVGVTYSGIYLYYSEKTFSKQERENAPCFILKEIIS